jgi:hypothetical protein
MICMNTITINLTDRQLALLDTLAHINVDVAKAVVNNSALHADERKTGAKRADQKSEIEDLLYVLSDATRPASRETDCSICGRKKWDHAEMDHQHVTRRELTGCYDGGVKAARYGMRESENPFTNPEKRRAWATGFRQTVLR